MIIREQSTHGIYQWSLQEPEAFLDALALLVETERFVDPDSKLGRLSKAYASAKTLQNRSAPVVLKLKQRFDWLLRTATNDATVSWQYKIWGNILSRGHSIRLHNHADGSHWALVYFVEVEPDCGGNLVFPSLDASNEDYVVAPKPGLIVAFPASYKHLVSLYIGAQERISVAANATPDSGGA